MTTEFNSSQLSTLTAILNGEEPKRAAKREIALTRFIATAKGHGLEGVKKLLAGEFAEAQAKVEAHAAKLNDEAGNADRPGDAFERHLETAAEASTKSRRRKPIVPAAMAVVPEASPAAKPWFRDSAKVMARMFDVMTAKGANKLAIFRAAFAEGQPNEAEWSALSQTQQNGILIRAIQRLMEAGKLTREGLIYGVKG